MNLMGKKNVYLCQSCGHGFVTLDLDKGTTPFMTKCVRKECGAMAQSFFYRVPQEWLADVPPVLEWYHPTPKELETMSPGVQKHVAMGGLISRPTRRQ